MSNISEKKHRELSVPKVFSEFQKACLDIFQFLIDDYGFEYIATDIYGYECSILFRAMPNVAIRVYYEVGGVPWAMSTVRVGSPANPNETKEWNLDALIRKFLNPDKSGRCPEFLITKYEHGRGSDAEMRSILQRYADFLRTHGEDILHGDFKGTLSVGILDKRLLLHLIPIQIQMEMVLSTSSIWS
jgi:hypothetical protein